MLRRAAHRRHCDVRQRRSRRRAMPMTLRHTPEETEALRDAARREHRSMQEVAREAIAVYVSDSLVNHAAQPVADRPE